MGPMTGYALAYRLGYTPWERYRTMAARSIGALLDREADERSRVLGRALDLGCGRGGYTRWLADSGWLPLIVRFGIVIAAIGVQLLAYHLWLAAGRRRLADVWPGVLLSIVLWLLAARLFGSWLAFSNYSRFYAGLTSIMSALVFFQISAIIIILGAELNRGLLEIKDRRVVA